LDWGEGLSSGVSIRFMTAADIPAGLALCRAAHWNQTARDWEFFLSAGPEAALAAEEEGRVVGTVATVPYGTFTWISMVLVDPLSRGKGIGRLLLERGLALLPPGVVARLDATAAGEPLYRSLGFESEHGLTRWFVDAMPPERPADVAEAAPSARPLAPRDWPMILKMDRHLFGASRTALLERMAAEAPEYAWVLEVNDHLRGYMFGRHGHVREHLGPLIADTPESAHVILEACLSSHARQNFFIDVPDRHDGWADVLAARRFAIERPFLRMYRGRLAASGNPSVVYAVTGPEFG
jgi:GNAT superfamily N-acetyltransferase